MAGSRALWLALALAAIALLALARWLDPSHGFGTHEAFGLAPCGFRSSTGLPCPACGLTTAFAELARGDLLSSLRAHPLGLPLFAAIAATPIIALRAAQRGEGLLAWIDRLALDRAAYVIALSVLATWAARLVALAR